MKSPIKWVGGKRQLLPELLPRVPKKYSFYYEPFCGSAALFFALNPSVAFLTDSNQELMNTFATIRDYVSELIDVLKDFENTEEMYYSIRAIDREPDKFSELTHIERAARFIYLNKTCFNGLYRVNSNGQFNVPYGRYTNPTIVDEILLRRCSNILQDVILGCTDFRSVCPVERSFVYFDPPYVPLTVTSSFTSYTKDGFSNDDHRDLFVYCKNLDQAGIKWMQSNSSAPFVLELYKDYNIEFIEAKRKISASIDGRKPVQEVIIRNYR